jgi:hypothetical protein
MGMMGRRACGRIVAVTAAALSLAACAPRLGLRLLAVRAAPAPPRPGSTLEDFIVTCRSAIR